MSGFARAFQKVPSALILSCGLAFINQPVLVSVISKMAITRRKKKSIEKVSAKAK